ncbi:hypothetical protein B0O80DRAFT_455248 [Mortierella sp. GBAus27b]|nr:hypothetical protein BGX31_011460 [Mortierella sp. GBA43]KAI8351998.1 hypothetical protein B0O80DRAFT_455248 [Mortierella sp. GBAus27b]
MGGWPGNDTANANANGTTNGSPSDSGAPPASPVPGKRRSWSFFTSFRSRRSSLPAQSYAEAQQQQQLRQQQQMQQDLDALAKNQMSQGVQNDNSSRVQFLPQDPVSQATTKRNSAPVPEQAARVIMATTTQEQLTVQQQPRMGHSSRHPSFSSMDSMVLIHHGDMGSGRVGTTRNNAVDPLISPLQLQSQLPPHPSQGWPIMGNDDPVPVPKQEYKRRKSFMPAALKTSGLVKLVGGVSRNTSPTSQGPASPKSPRSPNILTPRPAVVVESKDDTLPRMENRPLTIEQFKWSILCCCNEIKTRVRQRLESHKSSRANPDVLTTPAPVVVPTPPKKAEKKVGRFNGLSSTAQPAESLKDTRATLNSLLQVMAILSTTEEAATPGHRNVRGDGMFSSQDAAAGGFYHGPSGGSPLPSHAPLPLLSHNPSLLSLMGTSRANGEPAEPPSSMRSGRPTLTHHPSYSMTLPSTNPSNPYLQQQAQHQQQQQQQQQPPQPPQRLRSLKQSKIAAAGVTDNILKPLTLEDLVRLMAYTLSIAPEEWIPTHLYDFFERPQGQKYRDLVELLPTQSQRILRSILETVDGLVDCAVLAEWTLRDQPSPTSKLGSLTSPGGLRHQLSQVHLRSRNESTTGPIKTAASPTMMMYSPENMSHVHLNGYAQQQQEDGVRVRKRRVILDSLSALVFRSAQDVTIGLFGNGDLPSTRDGLMSSTGTGRKISRPTLDLGGGSSNGEERSSKGKRNSTSAGGLPPLSTAGLVAAAVNEVLGGGAGATAATRLQSSDRETGLRAFENLMAAYEEEYCSQKVAIGSAPTPDRVSKVSAAPSVASTMIGGSSSLCDSGVDTTSPFACPISMPSSPPPHRHPQVSTVSSSSSSSTSSLPAIVPPRMARSLPSGSSAASTAMELVTLRSLSLPPWRKQVKNAATNTCQVRPGQDPKNHPQPPHVPPVPSSAAAAAAAAATSSSSPPPASSSSSRPNHVGRARLLSEPTLPLQSMLPPSARKDSLSSTMSSTWSTWKGHLLVLEEEEYVIEDGARNDAERPKVAVK